MTDTVIHIPTLETPRLVLRAHKLSDIDVYAAALASERSRWMTDDRSRGHAWASFVNDVASWSLHGFGVWAVDLKDGTPVGQTGLNQPEYFPETEIGWLLYEGHEGRGYAFEAASAALNWAWDAGFDTLVSYITPQNTRSRALAERLGAVLDPDAQLPDGETPDETVVYRHRPDADGSPEAYA